MKGCEADQIGPPSSNNEVRNRRSFTTTILNPLNAELNPIRHLLALVGARHIVRVSRIWVKRHQGAQSELSESEVISSGSLLASDRVVKLTTHLHLLLG